MILKFIPYDPIKTFIFAISLHNKLNSSQSLHKDSVSAQTPTLSCHTIHHLHRSQG
jgi:hypothetical protein